MKWELGHCSDCLCQFCLFWWSSRCKHGRCFDDYRVKHDPYTNYYPERHLWSDSHKPGEQQHWCRGGSTYPTEDCEYFELYEGQDIQQCYRSNVVVYQDGYKECSMMVNGTCERCLKEMDAALNSKTIRKEET